MRRRLTTLFVLLLPTIALSPGCVAFVYQTQGRRIDSAAVEKLEAGRTTLPQILDAFGAPLEVHDHVDGRLLVYRHRERNTFRIAITPNQVLRFFDLTQVLADLLSNLKFTYERTHQGEDRLVLLLDSVGKLQAVSYRVATADLPVF